MRSVVLLFIAICGLVFVRATTYYIPVWSLVWWAWIVATVGVAACWGGACVVEWLYRHGRLEQKPRRHGW
jgi:hypothetical protein